MDQSSTPTIEPPLRILLVEDNEAVGEAMVSSFERSGMSVAWALTGKDAIALKQSFIPNIVLLDLQLPDMDGTALIRFLVEEGGCGIIIISELTSELDVTIGLELGADDYVAKPPHTRELQARIRAVHRRLRTRNVAKVEPTRSTIQLGKITVDLLKRTVLAPTGCRIALTAAEFSALEMLLAAKGETVSRDRLCEAALHRPWRAYDRSVDQLILSLRQKLSEGDQQHMIHSIRGAGYMLSFSSIDIEAVELMILPDLVP